jgi:hypothetical protein
MELCLYSPFVPWWHWQGQLYVHVNVFLYGTSNVKGLNGQVKADSHIPCPCRSNTSPMPCHWGFRLCLSHFINSAALFDSHMAFHVHAAPPCHATIMPFWKRLLKATAQYMGMAWNVLINIGRPETACERPARFRLPTTRSSTKVVFRSIPIR